ncbi:MAG TPA: carboxypeptidase-like regulatory domain-containing protein [Vicinamibacterales bacterium]|jgi:hypothetical protein|nr:carboxypeptidase-like regulatory domain-containing protein [Vicinamibacterales bacterium]
MRFLLFVACLGIATPALCEDGSIAGTVVDPTGAFVAHVTVTLSFDDGARERETESTDTGAFSFASVGPGPYRLSFAAAGFATTIIRGELVAGQAVTVSPVVLTVARFDTEVNVTPSEANVADAQIKAAEHQRVVGFFPNFLVSYERDAAPLNARQKFELSWKGFVDPAAFVSTAFEAGIAQATNSHAGFGRGAEGYGKRYASAYAEFVTRRVVAKVVMPIAFRQDPRYFYRGEGTTRSRFAYAVSRSVICRGDDKTPQVCYSSLLGRLAAGTLTNLYLPAPDRNSPGIVLENAALGIGGNAFGNLLQEFVVRKLSRRR